MQSCCLTVSVVNTSSNKPPAASMCASAPDRLASMEEMDT